MIRFPVSPEKAKELAQQMELVGLREADLHEQFVKSSGSGGQKVNKTSSCVYLKHLPTGIEVKCQKERSQALNRFFARRSLCEKLEMHKRGISTRESSDAIRIRKQKKRSKRRSVAKQD